MKSLDQSHVSPDGLVNWQPIAQRLNLKQRAFWDAVHREAIPHYRINARVIRFRVSEVEKWLRLRQIGELT